MSSFSVNAVKSASAAQSLKSQRQFGNIKRLLPEASRGRFSFQRSAVGYIFQDVDTGFTSSTLDSHYIRSSPRAQLHDLVLLFLKHLGILSDVYIEIMAPGLGKNQPDGILADPSDAPGPFFDLAITHWGKSVFQQKSVETENKCSLLIFGRECLFNFKIPDQLLMTIAQLQDFLSPLLEQYQEFDSYEYLLRNAPEHVTHPGKDHFCYLTDSDCSRAEESAKPDSEEILRKAKYDADFPALEGGEDLSEESEFSFLQEYHTANTEKAYDGRVWTSIPLVHPDAKFKIDCDSVSRMTTDLDDAIRKAKLWKETMIPSEEHYHDKVAVKSGFLDLDVNLHPGYRRQPKAERLAYNGMIEDDLDSCIDAICIANATSGRLPLQAYFASLEESLELAGEAAGWSKEKIRERIVHMELGRDSVLAESEFLYSLALREALLSQRSGMGREYVKHVFGDLYVYVKTIEPAKPIFVSFIFPQSWKTPLVPGTYRPCIRLSNGFLMTRGHTFSVADAQFIAGNDLRMLALEKGLRCISSNSLFIKRTVAFATIISHNCKQGEADALQQMRYLIPKSIAPHPHNVKSTFDKMPSPCWTPIQRLIPQRFALWLENQIGNRPRLVDGKLVGYTCPIIRVQLESLHEALSVAYLYFYHNPDHADPVMSQWAALKKTLKMNAEVQDLGLAEWRGERSHEILFSREIVWEGCLAAWKHLHAEDWLEECMQNFQSESSGKLLSEYATNKSSNQYPDEYGARSKTYVECIKLISFLGLYPIGDMSKVQEMAKHVMDCDIFRKAQAGGDRLITIMIILSRICLDWLEQLARSIARHIPSEKIVHWKDKNLMMKRFYSNHKDNFCMCANIDMSSWAEGLTTHQFFLIFKSLLYGTQFDKLLPLIASVINVEGSETLKVFQELAEAVNSGRFVNDSEAWRFLKEKMFETEQGAFKIHCPRGMGQGTLQVSSSVLHAIFDIALMLKLKEAFPEINDYDSGVSSDDQVILISFGQGLPHEKQLAIERFIDSYCKEWGLVFNNGKSNFFWGQLRDNYAEFNSCVMIKESQFHPLVSFLSNVGNLSGQSNLQDRSLESSGLFTGMVSEGLFGDGMSDIELLLAEYVLRTLGLGTSPHYSNFVSVWKQAPLPCFGIPVLSRPGFPGYRQFYLLIDRLYSDSRYREIVEKTKSLGLLSEGTDLGLTIIPKLLIGSEEESKSAQLYKTCVEEGILFDSKTLRELEEEQPLLFVSKQRGFLAMKARFSYEAERKARLNLAIRDSEDRVMASCLYVSHKPCLMLSVADGRETIHMKLTLLECFSKIRDCPRGNLPWKEFDYHSTESYLERQVEDKFYRCFWVHRFERRGLSPLSDKTTILWKLFGLNPYYSALDNVEKAWTFCLAKYPWLSSDITEVLSNLNTNIFNLYQSILTMSDDESDWHLTKPVETYKLSTPEACNGALCEEPSIPLEDRRMEKFISDCLCLDLELYQEDEDEMIGNSAYEGFVPLIRDHELDLSYSLPPGVELVIPFSSCTSENDIKSNYILMSNSFLGVCFGNSFYVSKDSDFTSWKSGSVSLMARSRVSQRWTQIVIDISKDYSRRMITHCERGDIENFPNMGIALQGQKFPCEVIVDKEGYNLRLKYECVGCHYLQMIRPHCQNSDYSIGLEGNPEFLEEVLRFNLDVPVATLRVYMQDEPRVFEAYLKCLIKRNVRFSSIRLSQNIFRHLSGIGENFEEICLLSEADAVVRLRSCILTPAPRNNRRRH